jgi:hypothetical protein
MLFMFNPEEPSMSQDSSQNNGESDDKARWSGNPFAAPGVEVDEVRQSGEYALLPEPNRLSAGAGFAWVKEGWALMQGHMGAWIGMGFIFFIFMFGIAFVPLIGSFVQILLTPVFLAGTMLACRAKEQGGDIFFSHLFAGFSNRTGDLMLLALFYFLVSIFIAVVSVIVIALTVGFGALKTVDSGGGGVLFTLLMVLFLALFFVPLVLAQWLSPPLVALHEDLKAWEAYKLAIRGVLRNLLPFTVLGIAFTVLGVLALIPLGLGLLLLWPLSFCTFYAAYRDIFIRQP